MSNSTCSIDGCGRGHLAHGLCSMHYARLRRLGEAGSAGSMRAGGAGDPCKVDGCSRDYLAIGFCKLHYQRWAKWGDPMKDDTESRHGEGHPLWVGDSASYHTAHRRIFYKRGSTAGHECVDCGEEAAEWSYDHNDPHEKQGLCTRGIQVLTYSPDPYHYSPRCRPCHRKFDSSQKEVSHV